MRVDVVGISKHFAGVPALDDVSLAIADRSIHGLVGENGAGKSTLGKIIAGVQAADAGRILVDGQQVAFGSPRDALDAGIAIIQQELALVPQLTVAENVFLGLEPARAGFLKKGELVTLFEELRATHGFDVAGQARVANLSVAERQEVEILRAVSRDAKLIIMDEPTSALTPRETAKLHAMATRLRERGTTIIYVSHFIRDVLELCDQVSILRNGKYVRTGRVEDETVTSVATAMLGREISTVFPQKSAPDNTAPAVLAVHNLARPPAFRDISFTLRAGEILGIAGLIGSGRSEVAHAIFGANVAASGSVSLDGRTVSFRSPRQAIDAGIAMVPESRRDQGLLMQLSVMANVSLANLDQCTAFSFISRSRERSLVSNMVNRLSIKTKSLSALVSSLSGGNQQRVLFGKWLSRGPRVLILDEPTRGIDIGAKIAIYGLITELADSGVAILLISSELEEVVGLAHRVMVMRRGRMARMLDMDEIDDETILAECLGVADQAA